jgi:hypothetical protein
MATASLSGLQALRLPDLLVLIKRTAEWARNLRVQNRREAMVPDEVQQAKALYARARAWPLTDPLQRAEPKWRKPGDVEAAFFALYDGLRFFSARCDDIVTGGSAGETTQQMTQRVSTTGENMASAS